VILPGLRRSLDGPVLTRALLAIEQRAVPLLLLSVVLFAMTGGYLLFTDDRYDGIGNFFATTWTTLMLVKHLLIGAMVAVGVVIDLLIDRLSVTEDDRERRHGLGRLTLALEAMTGLGAIVILLTAAAQAS
jgi:uncharacterized membrane protein